MIELISFSLIFCHFIFFLIASTVISALLVNCILTRSSFSTSNFSKTSSKNHISPYFTSFVVTSKFATILFCHLDISTLSKGLRLWSIASF